MNQRIQQLALEAEVFAKQNNGDFHYFYTRKLAELIVRECANAFETEVDTWKEMDPYQGSIKRQGTKAIKEHFGVR
jgi:hypothetical protein